MIVEKKYNACGTFIPSPVKINYNRLMENPSKSITIDSWKESTRVNHKHTVDSEESLNFIQYTKPKLAFSLFQQPEPKRQRHCNFEIIEFGNGSMEEEHIIEDSFDYRPTLKQTTMTEEMNVP